MNDFFINWLRVNDLSGLVLISFGSALALTFWGAYRVRPTRKRGVLAVSVVFPVVTTVLFASLGMLLAMNDVPGGGWSAGFGFILVLFFPIAVLITWAFVIFLLNIALADHFDTRRGKYLAVIFGIFATAAFTFSMMRFRTDEQTKRSYEANFKAEDCSNTSDPQSCVDRAAQSGSGPSACSLHDSLDRKMDCLLNSATTSHTAEPCAMILAIEGDPKTIFWESVKPAADGSRSLTNDQGRNAITKLGAELSSGKCFSLQADRTAWLQFCQKMIPANEYSRIMAARCTCLRELKIDALTISGVQNWLAGLSDSTKSTYAEFVPKVEFPTSADEQGCIDLERGKRAVHEPLAPDADPCPRAFQDENIKQIAKAHCLTGDFANWRNSNGQTVLHLATRELANPDNDGFGVEDVRYIAMTVDDTNARDSLGNTALHYADDIALNWIFKGIQTRTNVQIKNNDGETILVSILKAGHHPLDFDVERLVKAGLDVNARDKSGRTALHYLADLKMPESWPKDYKSKLREKLISLGADTTIKDGAGHLPQE